MLPLRMWELGLPVGHHAKQNVSHEDAEHEHTLSHIRQLIPITHQIPLQHSSHATYTLHGNEWSDWHTGRLNPRGEGQTLHLIWVK
jgi:hypothetical protein